MDPEFASIMTMQRSIDGSMLEESAAIWYQLLRAQHGTWNWHGLSAGDYLEIGVLHGKSASVLANFTKAYGNSLTVVDPEVRPEMRKTLDAISPRVRYLEATSESLFHSDYHLGNRRRVILPVCVKMGSRRCSRIAAVEELLGFSASFPWMISPGP